MVLRGKEQVGTICFSGNTLIRAVMKHCKEKERTLYIAYAIYLGEKCVWAGFELAGEMEHEKQDKGDK